MRRALVAAALVASAFLVAAGTASADTPFGGNPNGTVTPGRHLRKRRAALLPRRPDLHLVLEPRRRRQ